MNTKDYMAPMEGITNYIYRNAYHKYFHPMDKYFTPFITAKQNKRLSQKEHNEISPEKNAGLFVVPQILANDAENFLQLAGIFREYGHTEVNLNLGCPSPTVTAKGKGSGFLAEPEKLERFLDTVFSRLDMKLSIKTRIGTDDSEEWELLMRIYNKYPLEELILHPRLQKDYYQGKPNLNVFQDAVQNAKAPLCYNGDLRTAEDYRILIQRFPDTERFMYGRGLIANPGLVGEIRTGQKLEKTVLRQFHDEIYMSYQEVLSGDTNVLFRMKELWAHMAGSFAHPEKYLKKIRKAKQCRDYETAVDALFAEQALII
ncbi:MAG: tRNA dihydrouridine synthase [Blautia sp.]|jgi:tRNA-dihydrouridine synthase